VVNLSTIKARRLSHIAQLDDIADAKIRDVPDSNF